MPNYKDVSVSSFDEYEDDEEYIDNQNELYEYELHQAYNALSDTTDRLLFMDEGERNLDSRDYVNDEFYYEGVYKSPEWWDSYYESIANIDEAFLEEEWNPGVIINPICVSTLYGWENLLDNIIPRMNVIYLSDLKRYKSELAKFVKGLFDDISSGDIENQIDSTIGNGFWCIKIYYEGKYLYYWTKQEDITEIVETYEGILKKFEKPESVYELIPEEFLDIKNGNTV